MGLLNKLFGNTDSGEKSKEKLPWSPLQNSHQIHTIISNSEERPQVIFKHSTTCGVSSMVLRMFENTYTNDLQTMDFHFLDIHDHRSISNELAEKFQVRHESPQLLIIKNGAVAFHTSHNEITAVNLERFL